jgi:hypothetical protein
MKKKVNQHDEFQKIADFAVQHIRCCDILKGK